jgi:hypothetical protein
MNRQLAPYLFEIGLSILDSSPWRGGDIFLTTEFAVCPIQMCSTQFSLQEFCHSESWRGGNMVVKGGRIKTQKRRNKRNKGGGDF